ncbi:MAG: hypothetical protein R2828_19065 [Saprospiraceae bacterium]
MITLKYAADNQAVDQIEEQLKSLSLAYKREIIPTLTALVLQDGKETYEGPEAIKAHLEKIQGELKRWHYCSC